MKLIKGIVIGCILFIFLAGAAIFLYPFWHGSLVDYQITQNAEKFLSSVEIESRAPDPVQPTKPEECDPEPTEPDVYIDLWRDMADYNQELFHDGQKALNGKSAYERSAFILKKYGLEDEIFAVITIPVLDLEMPVYLGASHQHMADGAAIMGETSIPIGGKNTNCVIAGHRGWGGASYFRYIDQMQIGDTVTIQNLWETLTYKVAQIQIIMPNEVDSIKIQANRELVTLLSCHPYGSGGRQRYLVICERVENEPTAEMDNR